MSVTVTFEDTMEDRAMTEEEVKEHRDREEVKEYRDREEEVKEHREEVKEHRIVFCKTLRKALDENLQRLKTQKPSRHMALSITHLEDSIMRLGMELKDLGLTAYPNSYKPENTIVDPTEDGLKL